MNTRLHTVEVFLRPVVTSHGWYFGKRYAKNTWQLSTKAYQAHTGLASEGQAAWFETPAMLPVKPLLVPKTVIRATVVPYPLPAEPAAQATPEQWLVEKSRTSSAVGDWLDAQQRGILRGGLRSLGH